MKRSPHYHRLPSCQPWLDALVQLHRLGHADWRIAEILSVLSAAALEQLNRRQPWSTPALEELLLGARSAPPVHLAWSARQVLYWRQQLGLPGNTVAARLRLELGTAVCSLHDAFCLRLRQAQVEARWGHLLPAVELSRVQIRVLSLLRDRGPATARQLYQGLGHRSKGTPRSHVRSHGKDVLQPLLAAGLVTVTAGPHPVLYALAPLAHRQELPPDPADDEDNDYDRINLDMD